MTFVLLLKKSLLASMSCIKVQLNLLKINLNKCKFMFYVSFSKANVFNKSSNFLYI